MIRAHTGTEQATGMRALVHSVLFTQRFFVPIALMLLVVEAIATFAIIQRVAYTEIDWKAYMQQVHGVLGGERNYTKLQGDTGPLVYPAGFVWIYSMLCAATNNGTHVRRAQYVFLGVYLATQALALMIYRRARMPPIVLPLLVVSKRLHSIFVLRLFNDPVAMLFAYAAVLSMTHASTRRWSGLLLSLGIAVKMNVQLLLPGAAFVWWRIGGLRTTVAQLVVVMLSQVIIAAPFVYAFPHEYVARAFEYTRQFNYVWTVNWRFVSEHVFASHEWALTLAATHIALLIALAVVVWPRLSGSTLPTIVRQGFVRGVRANVSATEVTVVMFTANFVGVVCARSLHYQFYAWYAHMLPLLLVHARLPAMAVPAVWLAVECAWNVFPSTRVSSLALLAAHAVILVGIFRAPAHAKLS
ncbi:dolichyl-P-Man:Man(5)GlcNAc(2)-PP-dolichol alpha-1,3-mannosyltransferase [Coemansia sp. RSA 720]|nr:dolichyl-P-Man:Man(5)GlcNAc(2)-PP-dolichol alpha-1,3-mannosyltransferase [Coemansia sp. RSA 720]